MALCVFPEKDRSKKMRQLHIRLTEKQFEKLERLKEEKGFSFADLVRIALDYYLKIKK
jgi:hypothetical protein